MYDVLPDVNKNGKWGKTSWDSFSYALLMGHNVWMHLTAVQEANRRFDAGEHPAMMRRSTGDYARFEDIVEAIFAAPTREESEAIIEYYDRLLDGNCGHTWVQRQKSQERTNYSMHCFSRTMNKN
jgi:hypothetical protein